jgi:hypothetical protein
MKGMFARHEVNVSRTFAVHTDATILFISLWWTFS